MRRIFLVLCIGVSCSGVAQENEFWSDINLYKNLNEQLTIFGDAGPRVVLSKNSPYGFYIRPSVSYKLSNHSVLSGGIAWFYVNSREAQVNEFRGWQGARFEWKVLNRVTISSFNRLEERLFFEGDQHDFVLRFRALAGIILPLNHETLLKNTWYLPVAYEVFEDLNDHQSIFINRTRVYTGLGYVVNDKTRVEVYYIANESRNIPEEEFTVTNVIRLRIHFTLPERAVLID